MSAAGRALLEAQDRAHHEAQDAARARAALERAREDEQARVEHLEARARRVGSVRRASDPA